MITSCLNSRSNLIHLEQHHFEGMLFHRCEFEGLCEYVWRFTISIILRVNMRFGIEAPALFQKKGIGRKRDYPGRDKEITVKRLDLSGRSGTSHSTTIKFRIRSNGTIQFRYNQTRTTPEDS